MRARMHRAIHALRHGRTFACYHPQALLRKHKVQSLLLLLIAAVVGGFALVMGGMSFVSFAHAVQTGEAPGLRPICEAEAPDR